METLSLADNPLPDHDISALPSWHATQLKSPPAGVRAARSAGIRGDAKLVFFMRDFGRIWFTTFQPENAPYWYADIFKGPRTTITTWQPAVIESPGKTIFDTILTRMNASAPPPAFKPISAKEEADYLFPGPHRSVEPYHSFITSQGTWQSAPSGSNANEARYVHKTFVLRIEPVRASA